MFRDMVYAVAIGQIVPGDKEDMARTAFLNEAHAVDGAEIGGDENTGANVLHEVKRKAALCKKFSGGIGSTKHGGWRPSMGGKAKNTVDGWRAKKSIFPRRDSNPGLSGESRIS